MKKAIAFLLILVMLFSFCSCAQIVKTTAEPAAEPTEQPTAQPTSEPTPEITDDREIQRAISYGFVPDKLLCDYDRTITYAEFCEILTNLVTLYDKGKVSAWMDRAEEALKSDQPMQRDEGAEAVKGK